MNRTQSKRVRARVWPALGAMAIVAAGLTGFSGAWAAEAPAQVRTWTGAVSANWADAGNWSGGGAPGAADDVVIEGGKFQPLLDLTNGAVTIKSLTIGSKTAAAMLTFTNGNVTDKILIVKGDVTVGATGVLTHANETATGKSVGDETQRLCLEIGGNLTIDAGGAIRVAGCGYGKVIPHNRASGTHGGEGGFGFVRDAGVTAWMTPTYGSITNPVTAGGGGGAAAGGGVAVLRAAGRVTVNGTIDASGSDQGGAGGSVTLRAGELLGSGSVSANGGSHKGLFGGGGGGRIAVVLTKAATFGSVAMSAAGGAGGIAHGAAGTIYLHGAGQESGTFIVSNPSLTGMDGARTLIGPEVTGEMPRDVRVLDRARLVVTRDTSVALDNNSLWRYYEIQRCAYARADDGKLEPLDLAPMTTRDSTWPRVDPRPAATTESSPLPPADWAGLSMDDSAWPRVRLPKPWDFRPPGPRPQSRRGARAAILLRGKFELRDPATVTSCRLSVDYVGGVVVHVNGKEALRRHVPGDKSDLLALAEDYAKDEFATDKCDRHAREIVIDKSLLRQGVNVVAIEVHTAPYTRAYVKTIEKNPQDPWEPIGLLNAQLSIAPAAAVAASAARPAGVRVWNCAPYDTVSLFDYGDPTESLRPVTIHAVRNSVFSGRLMVGSDQTIKGLKATVSDLKQGGATLPAASITVRYALPAATGAGRRYNHDPWEVPPSKSAVPPHRFDGLFEDIPAEIPVFPVPEVPETFRGRTERRRLTPGAVAPLWFTVRVPRDAKPGVYEGRITIGAEGLPPTNVSLRVSVGDWIMPDPKEFRMQNLAYNDPEKVAGLYGVPLWSDRHMELQGRSQALMAEVGARQVIVNLCPDALGNNNEGLVRWVKQPDGSYKHDYAAFDKYLDMVASSLGKPSPLQLHCWQGDPGKRARWVSVLDPATNKIGRMKQPDLESEEAVAFWKPVFDEVLKKIKARGWLEPDVTVMGYLVGIGSPQSDVTELVEQLWPEAVWGVLSHNGQRGWRPSPPIKVRYSHMVYAGGVPSARGYRELLKPQSEILCNSYRVNWSDHTPLNDQRRVGEDIIMSGRDGVSDFGVCGGGPGYPFGPATSQHAILYPGPDGLVATERFEMFREGVEMAETLIYIERAIQEKKLSPALQQKAEQALEARSQAFIKDWFAIRDMPGAEEDAKLLGLAGEVAREMAGKK
ncbi:MAG: glycoside hydrolase domain-containing protein [Kiritimatiellia bacterium]